MLPGKVNYIRDQLAMAKMDTVKGADTQHARADSEISGKQVLKLHLLEKP